MPDSSPSTSPRTATFDSQLIEDFLHTDAVLVDASCAAPMAVFLNNQGESEALVISKNSRGNDELCHVCREPLSDSGWNVYGVGAGVAAVALSDSGTAWAVGWDGQLWQNHAGRWSQDVAAPPGGPMPSVFSVTNTAYVPISVGSDGTVWAVNSGGQLYQYEAGAGGGEGQWQEVAGAPHLSQAPAGSAQDFWAISNSQIVRCSAGAWQQVQSPSGGGLIQVSVGADGSVWALDQQNNLHQYVGQQWQPALATPSVMIVTVVAADNIYGMSLGSAGYAVVRYDGESWQGVAGSPALGTFSLTGHPFAQLSASGDGAVWCAGANGVVWKYTPGRQSPWQRQMMPTGMSGYTAAGNVTEVVAGRGGLGLLAFYVEGGMAYQMELSADGTWGLPAGQGLCSGLGVTHQQGGGQMIVYGVTPDGDMQLLVGSGDANNSVFKTDGLLKGAKLSLSVSQEGGWFTSAVIGDALYAQWGTTQNPLPSPNDPPAMLLLDNMPAKFKEVIRLPFVENPAVGFYCGAVGTDGNIYMVFDLIPDPPYHCMASFVPLTGGNAAVPSPLATPVSSTGALIDGHGVTRIYATDANGKLWVIRQTGLSGDPASPWTWSAWHPLGNDCTYLANGPGTHATHELFTLDEDSFLNRLWQDPVSSNWHSAQLHKPTGVGDDPSYVSQYVTEVTVHDANGNLDPNVAVTVSVSEPVSVWHNGVQHTLDSTNPATFVTNPLGKVSLSTLALGLHTAQLTFEADGFPSPYVVYPPQQIQDRLASVDGPTLQNAQARTQSVPNEVSEPLVSSSGQSNCAPTATVMRRVFQIKSQNKIDPGQPTGVTPGTYTPPTYEELRAMWAAKVVEVRPLAPAGAAEKLGSWDSFWDDLARFGEDIWHGIRKGILALEEIVVDVKKGLIHVTLVLEQVGSAVISFLVKTIDDVVNAVAAAFRWLGAEVEKAIDWLKDFFSWGDILNTKTVIEYYINQVCGNLIRDLDPNSPNNVQQLAQAQFQNLIGLIAGGPHQPDAFSQSQTAFGPTTFNGSVSHIPVQQSVGRNALQPDGVHHTYGANQVKCNYAHRKTETYIHQGGTVTPAGGGAAALALGGGGSFADFLSNVGQHLDLNNPDSKYCQAQAAFRTKAQGVGDPHGLFDKGINEFLALLKDFVVAVIELVEEIVMGLLDLAGEALTAFQGALNRQIHIPVISWLYEKISGHPLTLLDLFSLIMAIPTTVIYKLIWGGAQASPPFTADQVKQFTSQPIPWPQIQGTGIGLSPTPLVEAAPGQELGSPVPAILGTLSLLNAILYGMVDMGTDIETINGPGESGYPLAGFFSGTAVLLSLASFGYSVPYEVLEKPSDDRTTADNCSIALWGLGGLSFVLNLVSLVSSEEKAMAKYLEVKGPVILTLLGAAQLGFGIYAAVEFAKDSANYNAAYSAAAVITPVPTLFKFLLLFKTEEPLLILVPLDVICDFGSGMCSFIEGLT